jgi:hypothetical protein
MLLHKPHLLKQHFFAVTTRRDGLLRGRVVHLDTREDVVGHIFDEQPLDVEESFVFEFFPQLKLCVCADTRCHARNAIEVLRAAHTEQ